MDVKYLDWVIESSQFMIVLALFIFHIYRSCTIAKRREPVVGTSTAEVSLFAFIQLSHVSYIILFVYLLKALFNLSKSIIDGMDTTIAIEYNNNRCILFQKIDVTLGIIARLFIHLFVSMRSKLGSTHANKSIWYKIGFILILSDLGLISIPWVIKQSVNAIYLDSTCIVLSYNKILLCWVLFSDFIIGSYCLFVFVLPLKQVLKWEKKTITPSTTTPRTRTRTSIASLSPSSQMSRRSSQSKEIKEIVRDRSLKETVHKIIFFSTIMIISSMTIISIAFILSLSDFNNVIILSLLPPIDNILNSWCIILQFADIHIDAIHSLFGRTIISFFQCNYCTMECWCCLCKIIASNKNNPNNNNISTYPVSPIITSEIRKPSFGTLVLHQTEVHKKRSESNESVITHKNNNKVISDSKVHIQKDKEITHNNNDIVLAMTPAHSTEFHAYPDLD